MVTCLCKSRSESTAYYRGEAAEDSQVQHASAEGLDAEVLEQTYIHPAPSRGEQ